MADPYLRSVMKNCAQAKAMVEAGIGQGQISPQEYIGML